MTDNGSSYDTTPDFGALYDAIPAYAARGDVQFYLEEAARAGSTSAVLEVGCGTGRLTLPLARAGHTVTGVDLSPAMLARARAKLDTEPNEVRSRVTLVEADARRMARPSSTAFDLAIIPFRVMQHLLSIDDQLEALTRVRECLRPGGHVVLDVFNPHFNMMTQDRSAEVEDTPEQPLDGGRFVRRTVRVLAVHWVKQVSDLELIYYVRSGERIERVVQEFQMRFFTAAELEHLVVRAGFQLDAMYGGFDRCALADSAPEMAVVASRPN